MHQRSDSRSRTRETSPGSSTGSHRQSATRTAEQSQLQGAANLGAFICPATDIYALSIVLYELLTGSVPFTADTPVGIVIKTLNDPLPMPQLICPEIGDELQSVIVKGAAKSLDDRYRTIADFRVALKSAVTRDSANATASQRETMIIPRTLERKVVHPQRRGTMIAAAVAALSASAGLSYWSMTQNESSQPISTADAVKLTPQAQIPAESASTATTPAIAVPRPAAKTDLPITQSPPSPAKTPHVTPQPMNFAKSRLVLQIHRSGRGGREREFVLHHHHVLSGAFSHRDSHVRA